MTYNIVPGPKMGMVTPEYLEEVAAIARKYDVPFVKLSGAQRIAFVGHKAEVIEDIWQEFGQSEGPKKPVGIHYIQACPGMQWCKYGRQDSLVLGKKLEKKLMDIPLPAKTKVGISGCPMNCCESYIRDVGIFGMKKGWSLVFGGNGGGVPRIGDVIATGLGDEEVLELAEKCLRYYAERARKFERTGRFMRRSSLDDLKAAVLGGQ
jgi:NAD(P)H-nitrite reductase large subunit